MTATSGTGATYATQEAQVPPRTELTVEVEVEGERATIEFGGEPPVVHGQVPSLDRLDLTAPVLREAVACASILAERVAGAVRQ